jgi:hypothetical protein
MDAHNHMPQRAKRVSSQAASAASNAPCPFKAIDREGAGEVSQGKGVVLDKGLRAKGGMGDCLPTWLSSTVVESCCCKRE